MAGSVSDDIMQEAAVKKTNKNAKPAAGNKGKVVVAADLPEEEEEGPETQVFDGSATTTNIQQQMTTIKEKYGDLFILKADYESEIKTLNSKFEGALLDLAISLRENYDSKLDDMQERLSAMEAHQANSAPTVTKSATDWTLGAVSDSMVMAKLRSLNDSHSHQATNTVLKYTVSGLLVGVCLHCLDAGKSPADVLLVEFFRALKLL